MINLIVRAAVKGVHHDEAPQRDVMKAAAPEELEFRVSHTRPG